MKPRTENGLIFYGGMAMILAVVLTAAWGASEDANPEKHVRSLPVNTSGEAVNVATEVTLAALKQVLLGTGNPIPLAFVDPGSDAYTAALQPGRACTRLRVLVGDSGVVVSLDDGTTESFKVPANFMDEIAVAIAADADIKVKRYTAGVAMTDLIVEVR